MTQYWAFEAAAVVSRMVYADAVGKATTFGQVAQVIENYRDTISSRPRKAIPL